MTISLASTFARLGRLVATDGLTTHELAIASAVRAARDGGADHVVLDILADRNAPSVVRERALGRVDQAVVAPRHLAMPAVA